MEQRCRDWRINMWIASMDFAKAFDTMKHKALWTALAQIGIEPQNISLLREAIMRTRIATVLTDKESDVFEKRGVTKQGDSLSSLLFNTVLQAASEDDLARWREKGTGISLSDLQADCFLEFAVRWRRAVVLYILGAAQTYDVRLQEKYRMPRAENPPWHDEKISQTQDRTEEKRWRSTTSKSRFCQWRMYEESQSNNDFRARGDNFKTESRIRASMGIIFQERTKVDIEIVSTSTQASFIQQGHQFYIDT